MYTIYHVSLIKELWETTFIVTRWSLRFLVVGIVVVDVDTFSRALCACGHWECGCGKFHCLSVIINNNDRTDFQFLVFQFLLQGIKLSLCGCYTIQFRRAPQQMYADRHRPTLKLNSSSQKRSMFRKIDDETDLLKMSRLFLTPALPDDMFVSQIIHFSLNFLFISLFIIIIIIIISYSYGGQNPTVAAQSAKNVRQIKERAEIKDIQNHAGDREVSVIRPSEKECFSYHQELVLLAVSCPNFLESRPLLMTRHLTAKRS